MNYTLKIEIYGNDGIRLLLPVTWEVGIVQAMELSKQLKTKDWTRCSSVGGVVNHCDVYADIYNEGSVFLTKKDNEEFK